MAQPPTSYNQVQWITVHDDYAQQRIDNFLFTRLKGVPKSRIYRMLRKGEVRVNKHRIQARYRLEATDVIRIPPLRLAAAAETKAAPVRLLAQRLEPCILYEDDQLMVLNKPSGIAVHGGSGVSFGIIEGMRQLRPDSPALELVHRLDKDTSGCLILAKKRAALRHLHGQFRCNSVDKRYTALLYDNWPRKKVTVAAPLLKHTRQNGEHRVQVSAQGKPAQTVFSPIKRLPLATLAEAHLLSGRTHQIRVHAAYSGHAVAGDERYAREEDNQHFRKMGLKRMFLHARHLSFAHPVSGQVISVEAPLSPELTHFLTLLTEQKKAR